MRWAKKCIIAHQLQRIKTNCRVGWSSFVHAVSRTTECWTPVWAAFWAHKGECYGESDGKRGEQAKAQHLGTCWQVEDMAREEKRETGGKKAEARGSSQTWRHAVGNIPGELWFWRYRLLQIPSTESQAIHTLATRRWQKDQTDREVEKKGGTKCRDLYPHSDIETCTERLIFPKQRVCHRRR